MSTGLGRLDGKVAIVTGGARGQGEATVRLFAAEGARVLFGDVLDDLGESLAAQLGDDVAYLHHDVRDEDGWNQVVAEAIRRFGSVDVLVNNAGVLAFGTLAHETSRDDYMRVVEINQLGTFLGMKAVLPVMVASGGGSIVNISSTNALRGYGGTVAYTASKWAIRGMTKTVALEYGCAGIRVNSIHPGGVETPMTKGADLGNLTAEEQVAIYSTLPLARPGQPIEVANLSLFLASDESAYCTGAEFVIDGGLLAGAVNPHVLATRPESTVD